MKKHKTPGQQPDESRKISFEVNSKVKEGSGMKGKQNKEGVKTLLTLAFMWIALATMPGAFAQGTGGAGGGTATQGAAGGGQPDGANANPGSAWTSRQNYFLRFPVAKQAYDADQVGEDGKSPPGTPVQHTNPGDMVYQWPTIIPTAMSTPPTARDSAAISNNLFKTFGYPVSDSQFQIIERYNHNRMLEQAFDPERAMWTTQTAAGMGANNAANSIGASGVNQVCQAIDYCSMYLNNFTAEPGNVWQRIRDQLFIPMAVLLLLPGAVLAQVRAIVAQGSPVLIGQEVHPLEGILRSIVAIFLIPGSFLVINYGIDVANSITFTIASEYTRLFGSNMYSDAKCAILRAVPVEQAKNRRNAIREEEKPTSKGNTVWAVFEGTTLVTELRDPCAGIDEVRVKDEDVSYTKSLTRFFFNSVVNAQGMAWDLACTFQMVYLYYLWCLGPVAAALWVWPVASLRAALGSWCEGVITVCFWSLFWNTVILLMACFRGVGDSGTIVQAALLMLAIASVQSAFDFGGLASSLVQSAMMFASSAAQQMNAGAGNGGAGKSHSGSGGGTHQPHATAGAHGAQPGGHQATAGNGADTAGTAGGANSASGASASGNAAGPDGNAAVNSASANAANAGASGLSLNTAGSANSGTGAGTGGAGGADAGRSGTTADASATGGTPSGAASQSPDQGLPPASGEHGKGHGKGHGGQGDSGSGEGGGAGGGAGGGSPVSASVGLSLHGGSSVSNVNANNHLPPGVGSGIADGKGTGIVDPAGGARGADINGTGTGASGATGATGGLDANGNPIKSPLDGTSTDPSGALNGTANSGNLATSNTGDPGMSGAHGGSSLPPGSGLSDNLAHPTGDGTAHALHSPVDNSQAHSFTTTDANGNTALDTSKVGPLPPVNAANAGDPNASLAQHTTQDIMAMGGVSNDKLNLAVQNPGGQDYCDVRNATGVAPELLKAGLEGNSSAATVAAAGFGETPMAQHFAGTGVSPTADVSTAMAQSLDPGVAARAAINMDTNAAGQMLSSSNGAAANFASTVDNYRAADGLSAASLPAGDPRAQFAQALPTDSGTVPASQSDFGWAQSCSVGSVIGAGGGGGGIQLGAAATPDGGTPIGAGAVPGGSISATASVPGSPDLGGGASYGAPSTFTASSGDLSRGISDIGSVGTSYGAGPAQGGSLGAPVDGGASFGAGSYNTASGSYTGGTSVGGDAVFNQSGGMSVNHGPSISNDVTVANNSTVAPSSSAGSSYSIDGSTSVNASYGAPGVSGGGDLSRSVDVGSGGTSAGAPSYGAPSSFTSTDNSVGYNINSVSGGSNVTMGDVNVGGGGVAHPGTSSGSGAVNQSFSQDTTIASSGSGVSYGSGAPSYDGGSSTTFGGAISAGPVLNSSSNDYTIQTGGGSGVVYGGNDGGSAFAGPIHNAGAGSTGSVSMPSDGGSGYSSTGPASSGYMTASSDPGVVSSYGQPGPSAGPSVDNSSTFNSSSTVLPASGSSSVPDSSITAYNGGGWSVGTSGGTVSGDPGYSAGSGAVNTSYTSGGSDPGYSGGSVPYAGGHGSAPVSGDGGSSSGGGSYNSGPTNYSYDSGYVANSGSSGASYGSGAPTPSNDSGYMASTGGSNAGYSASAPSGEPGYIASTGGSNAGYSTSAPSGDPGHMASTGGSHAGYSTSAPSGDPGYIASSGSSGSYSGSTSSDPGSAPVNYASSGSGATSSYSSDAGVVYNPAPTGNTGTYFAGNTDGGVTPAPAAYNPAPIDPPSGSGSSDYYRDGGGTVAYNSGTSAPAPDNSGYVQPTPVYDNSGSSAPAYADNGGAPAPVYDNSGSAPVYADNSGTPYQSTYEGQATGGAFAENSGGGHAPHGGGAHYDTSAANYLVASNEGSGEAYTHAPRTDYTGPTGGSHAAPSSGPAKSFKDVLGVGGAFALGNKQAPLAKPSVPEKAAGGGEPKAPPPTEVASNSAPKKAAFGPAANARRQSGKSQAEIDEENRRLMAQMGEIPKSQNPEDMA
ncbi:MAG: hypothetical protein JST01_12160 [Cyanobacteria bacterium SZAS TMP-1]|nr:hypothetical protein [Cyanobacteria bacterium SZAS TMP-1]